MAVTSEVEPVKSIPMKLPVIVFPVIEMSDESWTKMPLVAKVLLVIVESWIVIPDTLLMEMPSPF